MSKTARSRAKSRQSAALVRRMNGFMRYTGAKSNGFGESIYKLCAIELVNYGVVRPPDLSDKSFCTDYFEKSENIPSKPIKAKKSNVTNVTDVTSDSFLSTYEWRRIRMIALKLHGPKCQCCGATPDSGAIMHVDHIKPRRYHPELALCIGNLQILCEQCNHGKGAWDETDWRPSPS